ncbi:hypothetical protein R1flu_028180 [Riccia fluitans]|uniref:Uncharacterized protein n=1 Tax=Riccia fluitans TaxID=41844 RepID=A0ABD1XKX7_9MARC
MAPLMAGSMGQHGPSYVGRWQSSGSRSTVGPSVGVPRPAGSCKMVNAQKIEATESKGSRLAWSQRSERRGGDESVRSLEWSQIGDWGDPSCSHYSSTLRRRLVAQGTNTAQVFTISRDTFNGDRDSAEVLGQGWSQQKEH